MGFGKIDLENLSNKLILTHYIIRKFNVNAIELEQLKMHPYLNYKQAKMIVNYRKQHGHFKQIKDIQKIRPISPEIFRKIAPYLQTHD